MIRGWYNPPTSSLSTENSIQAKDLALEATFVETGFYVNDGWLLDLNEFDLLIE